MREEFKKHTSPIVGLYLSDYPRPSRHESFAVHAGHTRTSLVEPCLRFFGFLKKEVYIQNYNHLDDSQIHGIAHYITNIREVHYVRGRYQNPGPLSHCEICASPKGKQFFVY